jgi:plasmid replication initiation protein
LNELEQKIINLIISEIQPKDLELKYYEFKISDFIDLLGTRNRGLYADVPEILGLDLKNGVDVLTIEDLSKVTRGLMSKVVTIKTDKGFEQMHWIDYVKYYDGIITIRIGQELKPYLLQLKDGRYTKYQLKNILPMDSKYAIRLYEIIKSNEYKKEKEFTIDVDRIKEILDIKEEYELYADFKRKVILIAQREINAKSDILFEFEENKTGRKVTSIKFIVHNKENIKETAITSINLDDEAIKKVIEIMEQQIDFDSAKKIYLKSLKKPHLFSPLMEQKSLKMMNTPMMRID